MKYAFVILCVVLTIWGHHLPDGEKQKLKEIHEACQADPATHVDKNLLKKLPKNVNNKKVGKHLLCMAVKSGLMTQDGDLIKDQIKEKIDMGAHDRTKIDEVVNKCVVKHETAEKTATLLMMCLIENNVHYHHDF